MDAIVLSCSAVAAVVVAGAGVGVAVAEKVGGTVAVLVA
jgi:hypothetical protein